MQNHLASQTPSRTPSAHLHLFHSSRADLLGWPPQPAPPVPMPTLPHPHAQLQALSGNSPHSHSPKCCWLRATAKELKEHLDGI